jgi:hypothetical protein
LLIAYAFVLYMAVFSGGRWIRSVLAGPGEPFWATAAQPHADATLARDAAAGDQSDLGASSSSSPLLSASALDSSVYEKLRTFSLAQQDAFEQLGLSFWFFPSLSDGLDVKNEFKRRLERVERLLTGEMRAEVLAEAKRVFVHCEGVVGELDEFVGRQGLIVRSTVRAVHGEGEGVPADGQKGTRRERDGGMGARARQWQGRLQRGNWYEAPGFAGLALVLSCVSWYAMYHAGVWSP